MDREPQCLDYKYKMVQHSNYKIPTIDDDKDDDDDDDVNEDDDIQSYRR